MRMILGLSGPIGVGKSWFANQLVTAGQRPWAIVRTSRVVWNQVRTAYPDMGLEDSQESLELFKTAAIGNPPRTGRDVIIGFIESHLAQDRTWLAQQVIKQIQSIPHDTNIVIDCLGRIEEFEGYQRYFAYPEEFFQVLAIAPHGWNHPDKLDDNYRDFICPPHHCRRFESSEDAWNHAKLLAL